MKKITLLLIVNILLATGAYSQGIQFSKLSFDEAIKKAKAENKSIFIDAYTEWCGPCKKMSAEVFTTQEVGNFYNDKFINLKIDMDKGEGLEIARKYNVTFYPTYLFFDNEGEMIDRSGGFKKSNDFIADGSKALNNKVALLNIEKNYNIYQNSIDSLFVVMSVTKDIRPELFKKANEEFLKRFSEKDYSSPIAWQYFSEFDKGIESKLFNYFVTNYDKMKDIYGEALLKTMSNKFSEDLNYKFSLGEEAFFASLDKIRGFNIQDFRGFAVQAVFSYYQNMSSSEAQFEKNLMNYYNTKINNNMDAKVEMVSAIRDYKIQFLNKLATQWSKELYDADKSFENAYNYGFFLYTDKQYQIAEKIIKEAISLGTKQNLNIEEVVKLQENNKLFLNQ
jgi:thioredoxin-related protein